MPWTPPKVLHSIGAFASKTAGKAAPLSLVELTARDTKGLVRHILDTASFGMEESSVGPLDRLPRMTDLLTGRQRVIMHIA